MSLAKHSDTSASSKGTVPENEEKRKLRKVKKIKLPKSLLPIKNLDKKFHEVWDEPTCDLLDFPHPFRGVLLGPPNSGKTTTVKNILMRQTLPFQRMYLVHCDASNTNEYKDVGAIALSRFPRPEDWPGNEKTLLVIDDVELKTMNKHQLQCLDRTFGYVSTHKNLSVLLCAQDPFNTPAIVRRCSNLWVLWPNRDADAMQTIARRCGVQNLTGLFKYCQTPKDSIWVDLTDGSPHKLRLNGYTPIEEICEEDEDEDHKS